jgi:hypothetical protein
LVKPLILRTYCRALARISSSLAGGSKLCSVRMFRHMIRRLAIQAAAIQRKLLGCGVLVFT